VGTCPKCGEKIPCSVLIDDTLECPKCGNHICLEENGIDNNDDIE